jgi:hypothetical protein
MSDQIEKWRIRLQRSCNSINKVLSEAQLKYPDANLYLDDTGNLNLMSGPPHSCFVHPHRDRELCSATSEMDCGAW